MKQSLCFSWKYLDHFEESFLSAFPKEAISIDIPHNIKDVPYNYFDEHDYQKVVTYEKVFDALDKDINNKVAILRFEGFMLQADIYFNGHHFGHHISGYLPVELDVSEYIKEKDNRLVVVLDSKEDNNIPPFGYAVDYLTFSGIYREVYLYTHAKTYLKDIYAHADMEGNVHVLCNKVGDDDLDITYNLYDKEHNLVISSKEDRFHIDNPHLWNIDDPYLYTLEITTSLEETYSVKVGFKTVVVNQYGFFLNEKHIKLLGLNRHQCYPYVGYAMPKSMQIDDAKKLKSLGINVVRTSHYPQSESFLSACDELGLLVLDEIPGWQHIGKDEVWRNNYYDFITRMVLKERHHPSLFAYGVRIDESKDDHELYQKGNQIAHELDPYRLTIGVRNTKNSELLEDIYGYNDFACADMSLGLINPNKVTKNKTAPILITEYMGHMEPVKGTSDLEKRKQVALRHARVIDDSMKYERLMGCIGWCFVDYYTHVDFGSGDHLCPHGVMDMYRNKKYTASIYESQCDDHPVMDILTNMRPGDFKEATYQDIIVATNMDRIDLYKNDEFVASFYPKNDQFKYLKHPPIYITDILGETFKDGPFTPKERKKICEVMSYGGIYGFGHLKMSHVLKTGKIALKYHLSWDDLVDIWNKHIATWGGYAKTFTFVGIKDNKEMIKKTIAPSLEFHMNYEYERDYLVEEDSYDVLPITVSFVDKDNNVMPYANRAIEIKTEGSVSLLGPSLQTLLGGQITLYIRSNGKGKGKVIIQSELETKEIELEVK